VVNARFAKPLDKELITDLAGRIKNIITVEENTLTGGFGSSVARLLQESGKNDVVIKSIGIPDKFIEHGSQHILRAKYGLDAQGIARQVINMLSGSATNLPLKAKK
jgi:1-deoxy-D-xylulose-5-phosphate synthase